MEDASGAVGPTGRSLRTIYAAGHHRSHDAERPGRPVEVGTDSREGRQQGRIEEVSAGHKECFPPDLILSKEIACYEVWTVFTAGSGVCCDGDGRRPCYVATADPAADRRFAAGSIGTCFCVAGCPQARCRRAGPVSIRVLSCCVVARGRTVSVAGRSGQLSAGGVSAAESAAECSRCAGSATAEGGRAAV